MSVLSSKIIPAEKVRLIEGTPHPAPAPHRDLAESVINHEPQVTLVKNGEIVKSIVIKCTCGEVVRLDCEY